MHISLVLALTFAFAALAALAVTPAVVRFVTRRGVYGHTRHPVHSGQPRIPRLGGVAVCVAMTTGVVLGGLLGLPLLDPGAETFFAGVLIAGGMLFAAGLADDLNDLTPTAKLLAQCAAAIVAYAFGFRVEELTFGETTLSLGVLAFPLTLLWIVGVTNAFNLIDGLDGLATGLALVALGTTFTASALLGNWEVALVSAALGGALAGFLRYNVRPARIFLGDSGSLLVGFMLAVLSVHGSTKSSTAVLAIIPLLVLGLPLLDTFVSIFRRWLRGVPVFGADERHLHHRLLAIGLTHTRAVILLYLLATGLASLAMVLAFGPPRLVTVTAFVGAAVSLALLLFGIHRLGYHEFVEAGVVVTTAVARVGHRVRDQIHARDVAQVLVLAESLEHVRAILSDNAVALGFLEMTVCPEDADDTLRPTLANGARPCRLDYPVAVGDAAGAPHVLRVWAEAGAAERLFAGERVVRVLAAAIRRWSDGPARPSPDTRPQERVTAPRASASPA